MPKQPDGPTTCYVCHRPLLEVRAIGERICTNPACGKYVPPPAITR